MRIVVAGIGGVGGYIGAKLCGHGDEVVLLTREYEVEKLREDGLRVVSDEGEFSARPDSVESVETYSAKIDLLLLCVKSYDIEGLLTALASQITPSTIIVPFSNGVEHKTNIDALVKAKVLNGAVYILAHKASPGVIVKKGKVFAALFGAKGYESEAEVVGEIFQKAGLRYKVPENIEEAIWKKYLFISTFAALTSYFDISMRKVYDLHYNWAVTLLQEIADIAEAKGIDVQDEIEKALKTASSLPEDASSSMHLDFQKGSKTELQTLCGYIVREGQRLRLPTPMMAKIYGVLKSKSHL